MPSCTVNLDEKASPNRHTGENGLHHFFFPMALFLSQRQTQLFFSSSLMTCFQANYTRSQMPHKKSFWDQIQTHAERLKEAFCTSTQHVRFFFERHGRKNDVAGAKRPREITCEKKSCHDVMTCKKLLAFSLA